MNTRNYHSIVIIVLLFFSSCTTPSYFFINENGKTGVDFTNGKWLLNQIDCPEDNIHEIHTCASNFFSKTLNERFYYRENVNGLLIPFQIPLNPDKQKLKELKIGTGFDYFINIAANKNRDELGSIGLYEDEYSKGANESEVTLEIYDLNSLQIIYSKRVKGNTTSKKERLPWDTKKSDRLIDNISFHKTADRLLIGSLKKILKNLKKKSVIVKK